MLGEIKDGDSPVLHVVHLELLNTLFGGGLSDHFDPDRIDHLLEHILLSEELVGLFFSF